ncbi:MAG: HAD-IA family hydrolase [Paraglaciecola sp.]|nr:HAD-IA family hydrolase [Paraglaciecola sp.]NCT49649.1 HAD-IA family hydrolase [Paraglaciecola sp.]
MIFYRKLQPFQAITFDLDDTLYNNAVHMPVTEQAFNAYLHECYPETKSLNREAWRVARTRVLASNPQLKHDMSLLRQQVLQHIFQSLGYQAKSLQSAVNDSYERFYFYRSNLKVEENIHSLLANLAEKWPLVAITNGNVNVEQIGLQPYFQHVFKASIHLPMKPDSALFKASKDALKLPAKQILHVGDSLQNDVYGALKSGFQSAWYAHDRTMILNTEQTFLLPTLQLCSLDELLSL